MDLSEIQPLVIAAAKKAGAFIREQRSGFKYSSVEIKGLNDMVSYVDKNAEEIIVNALRVILPNAGFIVEENTATGLKEYNWIVDPLDGTTNFIHGVPCYAVSIALQHKDEIVLGVVYEVSRDECFYALKNGGAFLDGVPIHTSERKVLSECLVATGFPIYNFSRLDNFLEAIRYLMQNTHGIRRIGAAAADLCYVAAGRMDVFFEYNLNAWDVAAGALILREAGGTVNDFSGGQNWLFGKEIVCANSHVSKEFNKVIAGFFN